MKRPSEVHASRASLVAHIDLPARATGEPCLEFLTGCLGRGRVFSNEQGLDGSAVLGPRFLSAVGSYRSPSFWPFSAAAAVLTSAIWQNSSRLFETAEFPIISRETAIWEPDLDESRMVGWPNCKSFAEAIGCLPGVNVD